MGPSVRFRDLEEVTIEWRPHALPIQKDTRKSASRGARAEKQDGLEAPASDEQIYLPRRGVCFFAFFAFGTFVNGIGKI